MDNFALRNYRDFLLLYNKISESCFVHCVNQLGERDLSQDESRCVDVCTRKYVNVNHKLMEIYLEIQPQFVNRRIEEINKQQEEQKRIENSESISTKGLKINTAGA